MEIRRYPHEKLSLEPAPVENIVLRQLVRQALIDDMTDDLALPLTAPNKLLATDIVFQKTPNIITPRLVDTEGAQFIADCFRRVEQEQITFENIDPRLSTAVASGATKTIDNAIFEVTTDQLLASYGITQTDVPASVPEQWLIHDENKNT